MKKLNKKTQKRVTPGANFNEQQELKEKDDPYFCISFVFKHA
jgi:hypothetical protein